MPRNGSEWWVTEISTKYELTLPKGSMDKILKKDSKCSFKDRLFSFIKRHTKATDVFYSTHNTEAVVFSVSSDDESYGVINQVQESIRAWLASA